jgi:D-alanyl-D-alanine carboxypeptidase
MAQQNWQRSWAGAAWCHRYRIAGWSALAVALVAVLMLSRANSVPLVPATLVAAAEPAPSGDPFAGAPGNVAAPRLPPWYSSGIWPVGFGHHAATEASPAELALIADFALPDGKRRRVWLHQTAALAFRRMRAAAAADGVHLLPLSGFRDVAYQRSLFVQAVFRYGGEAQAAWLVAAPGYSEHHTGRAVDIIDRDALGGAPGLGPSRATRWLEAHAIEFGFEQSFPPRNAQGVAHEPWHWRYVGEPTGPFADHPALSRASAPDAPPWDAANVRQLGLPGE